MVQRFLIIEPKKWLGVTDEGKVLYSTNDLREAEKLGVSYQIKHKIKRNPEYKSEK